MTVMTSDLSSRLYSAFAIQCAAHTLDTIVSDTNMKMKTRKRRACVTVLLWLLTIKHVKTDGKLDIRFISYRSDGKESSGYCCDGDLRWLCLDKCDPMLFLCIDGPDRRRPCSVYKSTTNYIDNHNTIHSGGSIQGTPNPFIVHISKAVPSSIEITVQVYDNDDTSSDDHMDTLSKLINIRAAATQHEAVYTPYTVWGRTQLKIAVRAYCDPDWYGSSCEKHCKAIPDHSHYTCHPHTGAKMCFEGWKGDNCNQDIDECTERDHICQNGGSCTNTDGSFECICVAGIKDIINITLLGEIGHTNRGDLADGFNRLITELGGIPGKVDVKFKTKAQRESNYTTTHSNNSTLPLYPPREEEEVKAKVTPTVKSPSDSWDSNQYVSTILPPVGLVLMSVLLMVAFCVWRRRSGKVESRLRTGTVVPCNRILNRPGTNTGNELVNKEQL